MSKNLSQRYDMKTENAYAKINTYLNVVSKRPDGYHNIVSIMQTVSLCDVLHIDFASGENTEIELKIIGSDALSNGRENLAWRAAEAFLQKSGRSGKVKITIEKNIPMAAGLAGGSADAAAVLRALYSLCGAPFPRSELYSLGATLGADIPFCIRGGSCLVKGIGEELWEAPPMPMGNIVIARIGEGVSTPKAYGALDEKYGNFQDTTEDLRHREILDCWSSGDLFRSCENFFNIFEDVVEEERPWVKRLKSIMREHGAICAMMSGSGPSVFGIFSSVENAKKACAHLQIIGVPVFLCSPCEKYPDM